MAGLDRRGAPKIKPGQILVAALVLGFFITGVVLGGLIGAMIVGVLAILAGLLLVARWPILDSRVRIFRAAAVLVTFAVALSLLSR